MAGFERRDKRSRKRQSRSGGRERRGRGESRDTDYKPKRLREAKMTRVTCTSCGDSCEVPFKPTSSKPVFCDACFSKEGGKSNRSNSGGNSKDLDVINKKLDKIMKALDIE